MQQLVAELGEVGAPAHQPAEVGHGDVAGVALHRDVGDDLLGQHVERVAQEAGGLDVAVVHPPHDDRRLEQVAAVLRVERALAGLADRWPARPMRCRPRLTAPGDSTWMTRSTAPMSMPSSRLAVATMPRSSPRFSSSSMTTRCSRASEPWWAFTSSIRRGAELEPPARCRLLSA